jgi:phosphate transport system ATP-binding protein
MVIMEPNKKIAVEKFSLEYLDGVKALKDISLSIYENQINVLLGPSGGGKSSLLRTINRLNDLADVKRTSGTVLLDGEDILLHEVDVIDLRRRVGMVFSRPVVLPMSIRKNITYSLELSGQNNKETLENAVERCLVQSALWDEVKDRLDVSAYALSGGQQQRLCIARSLASEPEIVLLDEPTSGLDPISTLKVEETLRLLRENYTFVFVPSSIQQAARISDYCAFLLDGKLIEHLPGNELFTNPQENETIEYVEGRFG